MIGEGRAAEVEVVESSASGASALRHCVLDSEQRILYF